MGRNIFRYKYTRVQLGIDRFKIYLREEIHANTTDQLKKTVPNN